MRIDTMDKKLAETCMNVDHVFEFRVEEILVKFLDVDEDEGVKFEYPNHDKSGWTEFEELEDLEVVGRLPMGNLQNTEATTEDWRGKPTTGWSTEEWKMRSNSVLDRTKKSLTQGLWAVHETSIGHTTSHLPSGLAIVTGIDGARRAKKTAYLLEKRFIFGFEKFWPKQSLLDIRAWAKGEDDRSLDEFLAA